MAQNLFTKFAGAYALTALVASLASCSVDDSYDLSNIDTNARFNVKDLVVPINIDDVKLETMLDLKDDSKVKKEQLADGSTQYYIRESGSFSSAGISIPSYDIPGSSKEFEKAFDISMYTGAKGYVSAGRTPLAYGIIPEDKTSFDLSANDVDRSILSVDDISLKMDISLSVEFSGLTSCANALDIENLKIQFVPGLTLTTPEGVSYDPQTGIVNIGNKKTDTSHRYKLTLTLEKVDCNKAGAKLSNGQFSFVRDVAILSGADIALYSDQLKPGVTAQSIPTSAKCKLVVQNSSSSVDSFSGDVEYAVKDINPTPVDLSNLPGILTQTGTTIGFENPLLKIEANNPLKEAGYDLRIQAGMSFVGNNTYKIASDALQLSDANNKFVLSPTDTKESGYKYVAFPELGKILSGDGSTQSIPTQVNIKVLDPKVPSQHVDNFALGKTLNNVSGKWEFYTPLLLTKESRILYKKVWDDWQDPDLDGLTVENGSVTVKVKNNVPLKLTKVYFSLDGKNGGIYGEKEVNIAPDAETDVEIPVTNGSAVSKITGATIKIEIEGAGSTLKPTQTITVSDVRAKVNGYYDKEL